MSVNLFSVLILNWQELQCLTHHLSVEFYIASLWCGNLPQISWETSGWTWWIRLYFTPFPSLSNMKPAPNMLRCAKGPLDDYLNVQREQTLPTSSTSAQVTVHDPYTIPCTTTSSVPVHFQPPHHNLTIHHSHHILGSKTLYRMQSLL